MQAPAEQALRALDDAKQFARTYRFDLSDDYLSLIEVVEAMPQNHSGADKTGIWQGLRAHRDTVTDMRLARRQ